MSLVDRRKCTQAKGEEITFPHNCSHNNMSRKELLLLTRARRHAVSRVPLIWKVPAGIRSKNGQKNWSHVVF